MTGEDSLERLVSLVSPRFGAEVGLSVVLGSVWPGSFILFSANGFGGEPSTGLTSGELGTGDGSISSGLFVTPFHAGFTGNVAVERSILVGAALREALNFFAS